jgi:hypothetical protein
MIYRLNDLRERNILYQYIKDSRAEFLANGGCPADFPNHLNKLGMKVEGLGLAVNDALVSFIELKYGNTK